jgi:hypothetical protein
MPPPVGQKMIAFGYRESKANVTPNHDVLLMYKLFKP